MESDGACEAYSYAEFLHEGVLRAILGDVLASSHVDVGTKGLEELLWARPSAEDSIIYHAESFEKEYSVCFWDVEGMSLAHELVGHHRHDELVSEGSGLVQVADVPGVKDVEDSVGEDDSHARNSTFAGAGPIGNTFFPAL